VVSEKAWICGIEAYVIHERLREVNRRREEYFERILMNVALFSCLDNEEMYKLILMIKELPPYKMDEIIVEKEDPVSRLYLVLKGEFSLCRKNLSGEITALQTFREGQFFDEEWIRSKTYSEVAVIARTDGILSIFSLR
jgi:CRP-like cAMP-binding protein